MKKKQMKGENVSNSTFWLSFHRTRAIEIDVKTKIFQMFAEMKKELKKKRYGNLYICDMCHIDNVK